MKHSLKYVLIGLLAITQPCQVQGIPPQFHQVIRIARALIQYQFHDVNFHSLKRQALGLSPLAVANFIQPGGEKLNKWSFEKGLAASITSFFAGQKIKEIITSDEKNSSSQKLALVPLFLLWTNPGEVFKLCRNVVKLRGRTGLKTYIAGLKKDRVRKVAIATKTLFGGYQIHKVYSLIPPKVALTGNCAVCMENFKENRKYMYKSSIWDCTCTDKVCVGCTQEIMKSENHTCPLCRQPAPSI